METSYEGDDSANELWKPLPCAWEFSFRNAYASRRIQTSLHTPLALISLDTPAATETEVQTTWLLVFADLLRAASLTGISLTTLEVLSYVCIRMLFHIVRTGIIMFIYATPKEILLPERYKLYMSPSDGLAISTFIR